jgi:hypothetical protein
MLLLRLLAMPKGMTGDKGGGSLAPHRMGRMTSMGGSKFEFEVEAEKAMTRVVLTKGQNRWCPIFAILKLGLACIHLLYEKNST